MSGREGPDADDMGGTRMQEDADPVAHLTQQLAVEVKSCAALSRAHARAGDARQALLALWAADVRSLQQLLFESGLGSAPDPQAQLAAVAQAVGEAMASFVAELSGPVDARALITEARSAMAAAFDESVHGLLQDRFSEAAHLDELGPVSGTPRTGRGDDLAGRTPEQLVEDLLTASGDCAAIATGLARAGDAVGAAAQQRLADAACFEAYLTHVAAAAGDRRLVTVDLRWDLATATLSGRAHADLLAEDVRACFVEAVGTLERDALRTWFDAVGPPLP